MRSATPAFYDKRFESGLVNVSGIRTGCTNSIIPACGLLNLPYFYEGCTCSYPLPCGLALVNMPEEFEQWASWGEGKPEKIAIAGSLGVVGSIALVVLFVVVVWSLRRPRSREWFSEP